MSDKKRIPLLLDEQPILVYPTLAKLLKNVNKAIILQQLHFLLNVTKIASNQYNFVDGKWWVYNSYEKWHGYFPWISISTIKGLFGMMEDDGLILSMQGVKDRWDRRKWYTIDYEAFNNLVQTMGQDLSDVDETKSVPSKGQNLSDDNRNTENTSEVTTEATVSAKKSRKKSNAVPASLMNPMKDAIALAFSYTWSSMTGIEKGLVQKAAKSLCEANITPAEIPSLYAYCKRSFTSFKPMALAGNVSEWRKTLPTTATNIIAFDPDKWVTPELESA